MNKRKGNVGLINFHCADNFGAVLQSYALQEVIKRLNFNVEIINFKPKYILDQTKTLTNLSVLLKSFKFHSIIKKILIGAIKYNNEKSRSDDFSDFREKHLNLSNLEYYTSIELKNNVPIYDFYITGSDQVWNPVFKENIGDSYFLDFAPEKSIKVSYAASIAQNVDKRFLDDYKFLINRFNYISIREKSSLNFLGTVTDKEVKVTLDPTLLLDRKEWGNVTKKIKLNQKYILVYDLEENKEIIDLANKVSLLTGLKVISYSNSKKIQNSLGFFKYKGPEEFLGYFENAELVLTNSFHGTVFSIIYQKPFYTIPHTTRGTRMIDLLNDLNLSDRIIYKAEELKVIDKLINYIPVKAILEKMRKSSIDYLKTALKNEENLTINED